MSSVTSTEDDDDATLSMEPDENKTNNRGQEKLVDLVSWLTNKIDKNVEEMQAEIANHMKDTDLRFAEAEARLVETNTILATKGAKNPCEHFVTLFQGFYFKVFFLSYLIEDLRKQ